MRSRKGILPGLCKYKKSPFTKNGKTDINAKIINTQEEIDDINEEIKLLRK